MIKAVGVKSVRMDDVASDLGMSKRTLYEMFGDKEELLSESILYMMEQRQKDICEKVAGCDNMVEVLLRSVRLLGGNGEVREVERRLVFNLKKFYPNVYEKVQRAHAECGLKGLQFALQKCLEQGYIDPNIDVELMARLFLATSGMLISDSSVVVPEEVTNEEAFGAMVVNFLRGLSTVKGLQLIDEILSREPRPLKLSERREMKNKQ
ncbi:MAG: TetR/AcrR family transcriptional regulator [Alistipes sp.]|nr:TetR/AcrR family transcriptional regulator [Alistipes sp.]MBQ5359009.1 TetR/AcrR family transcriptional regulator [Alistipes sp.]MBR6561158.1 TetR/AcrR family transcriptional regulator [Alistipes sp.]